MAYLNVDILTSMISQKKRDQILCIKCMCQLDQNNWATYSQTRKLYVCNTCRKNREKELYKNDPMYSVKQNKRYHIKRSVVIFYYGNKCIQCDEEEYDKLTIKSTTSQIHPKNLINYLYDNLVDKKSYQVVCYNCSKQNTYKDKYALTYKQQVLSHYGKYCNCGEDKIEKLTIGYLNNDRNEQRKKYKYHSGSRFYRWLINHNFPKYLGLYVVCYNCNNEKLKANRH